MLFEHSTVDSIKALTASKIQKIKDKHKGIRIGKYFEIRDAAKITIGVPNDSTSFIMKQAISQIFTFDEILNSYDERIDKIMDEQNSVLESIPGVGRNSASVILAEYNNFQGFPDADKLLAYAGLECSRYQSGESDYHGHMVKRGSPFLRYTLMNLAIALKNHNAVFKEYYLKKRDEGKHPFHFSIGYCFQKLDELVKNGNYSYPIGEGDDTAWRGRLPRLQERQHSIASHTA